MEVVHPVTLITRPPQRVLFLCVHNSSRSQMAEGFARSMAPPDVEIYSAGTEPRGVSATAVEVMSELGVTLDGQSSKTLDAVPWANCDTIVTLCGEGAEVCPTVPGNVRRVHWQLPDPSAAPEPDRLAAYREARDEIRWRVASLWPQGD